MRSQSPTTMSGSCHVTESLETLSGATNASHDETTYLSRFGASIKGRRRPDVFGGAVRSDVRPRSRLTQTARKALESCAKQPRGYQALSARTAGRSACVGSLNALAGTVTTPTVLPVMSKNSTEYPSSLAPGTTWRSTTVPTSPLRNPCSETSRVRITSLYSSKAIPLRRVHSNESGHVGSSIDLPNRGKTRDLSAGRLD